MQSQSAGFPLRKMENPVILGGDTEGKQGTYNGKKNRRRSALPPGGQQPAPAHAGALQPRRHRLPGDRAGHRAAVSRAERGELLGPDGGPELRAGAGDPCSGAAADGPGHAAHPGPLGREPRPAAKGQRACALDPEKQGPYLAAAVHLQRSCLRGPQHGGPPHGGLHPAGRHGTGAGCAGHRRRGHRPVGPLGHTG